MSDLTPELARRLGATAPDVERPEPEVMLDWALHWARQGMKIFPCARFLGTPLVEHWYRDATQEISFIVKWWSENPTADIAAVPDRSDCFVIIAAGEIGAESLAEIEAEHGELPTQYRYMTARDESEHLWIKGEAITSHNKIGRGLHVLGRGHYVYIPASWAPDHAINREE